MPNHPLSRRHFLTQAALAACAFPCRQLFPLDSATTLLHTPAGTLRGELASGLRIFRGVPFAQPPTGPRRFLPPEKLPPWPGERDATRFAAAPIQPVSVAALPPGALPRAAHSEDCLTLNLWVPEGPGPFPVFVWIHGGGFTAGHAFEAIYDGAAFAREGILCISVAYRLGVFGFLDLEPLLGPAYAGTANNALSDLIAALAWIQANIAALHGDPSRVTIGGQSAGAKLTDILLGTPAAQPLFHQAISESGGAERVWSRSNSRAVSLGFGKQWQLQSGQSPAAALATAPASLLLQTQERLIAAWPQHFPLRAEIDGALLPQLPIQSITAGSSRGKRLLIGTNRDESAFFVGPHPSRDATVADLGNTTLAAFSNVFRHYPETYPSLSLEQIRVRAVTAEEYWVPSIRVAEAHLQGGGACWMYRLDFQETTGPLAGYSYHSLDVPLVWGHPHTRPADAQAEAALSTQMHAAWAAFIRGETPAAPGLPAWPEYTLDTRSTLLFNTTSRIAQHPQQPELNLWDQFLPLPTTATP